VPSWARSVLGLMSIGVIVGKKITFNLWLYIDLDGRSDGCPIGQHSDATIGEPGCQSILDTACSRTSFVLFTL